MYLKIKSKGLSATQVSMQVYDQWASDEDSVMGYIWSLRREKCTFKNIKHPAHMERMMQEAIIRWRHMEASCVIVPDLMS